LIFLSSFAPLIHIVTESPSSSNPSPRAMRRLALSSHRDLYDLPQRRVSCPVLGLANFTRCPPYSPPSSRSPASATMSLQL
jgi:hypothetical protein